MKEHTLDSQIWVPRPIDEVFAFFADASNLGAITPPWLRFEIRTPTPIEMAPGTRIDYRLNLHGIPLPWRSEITAWEPPYRFVDEQRVGPYRRWIHEHTFEERNGGTLVRDRVRYVVPGGDLVIRLIVRRDIDRIFEYRRRELLRRFGEDAPEAA